MPAEQTSLYMVHCTAAIRVSLEGAVVSKSSVFLSMGLEGVASQATEFILNGVRGRAMGRA